MNRNKIPDFLKPSRSVRSNRTGNKQYLAYQQLAAIYLLRLALGKQKQLNRQSIKEFFKDDLGKLTGLAHCESVVDKIDLDDDEEMPTPKIKISKAQLLKHMHQHLSLLMEDGFPSGLKLILVGLGGSMVIAITYIGKPSRIEALIF